MEDPTKYKQEMTKMKEYKEEIKYVNINFNTFRKKEAQILFIKLNLKE